MHQQFPLNICFLTLWSVFFPVLQSTSFCWPSCPALFSSFQHSTVCTQNIYWMNIRSKWVLLFMNPCWFLSLFYLAYIYIYIQYFGQLQPAFHLVWPPPPTSPHHHCHHWLFFFLPDGYRSQPTTFRLRHLIWDSYLRWRASVGQCWPFIQSFFGVDICHQSKKEEKNSSSMSLLAHTHPPDHYFPILSFRWNKEWEINVGLVERWR